MQSGQHGCWLLTSSQGSYGTLQLLASAALVEKAGPETDCYTLGSAEQDHMLGVLARSS